MKKIWTRILNRVYMRWDDRGHIPWPFWCFGAHFCNEMDGLMVLPWDLSSESCCCGIIDNTERDKRLDETTFKPF